MVAIESGMISKSFVMAGRAVFTVSNGRGEHYTYKIKMMKGGGVWFAYLLTGPDNGASYSYLGVVNSDLKFRLTAKSKMLLTSKPVRVLVWALGLVAAGGGLPDGYAIYHAGRCGRCGRMLTHPDSIESGIGPECAKYL